MNITELKKDIVHFFDTIDVKVIDLSYIPGEVEFGTDNITGEELVIKTDDVMNITLPEEFTLSDENDKKLFEYEQYLYTSYNGLTLEYEFVAV